MAEALDQNFTSSNETFPNSSAGIITEAVLESLEFKYIKVTFYFLILFCATFGNAMVVYVICTSRRMRSSSHLLIMNLAVCDFFTPLISIPFDFALEENGYIWIYSDFMCKILYPAATFSTTASSLTLAAISLDRYRLLMHPFKKKLSSNQIKGIIIGIYIFCAGVVSPYTYVLNINKSECGEEWPMFFYRQTYTMTLFLFQYAIPLVFMTVMYTLAIINLYSTSGKVRHCSISARYDKRHISVSSPRKRGFKSNLISLFRKRSNSVDENPNVRATKMFMTVVVVFAVFMFPNQVLWLWVDFGNGSEQPNYSQTAIICWLFTYTNSVVNPIIFAIFSKDFRVGFKGVFRLIFCCNKEALPQRCARYDCHTKSDSSTNEILKDKDKQQTYCYDFSTCNTNVLENDSLPRVAPKYSTTSRDYNQNTGATKDVEDISRCEEKPGLKVYPLDHASDPHQADVPDVQSNEDDATVEKLKNDFTNFKASGERNVLSIKEVTKIQLIKDSELLHNRFSNVFPILPPNTIAMLDELPETNC